MGLLVLLLSVSEILLAVEYEMLEGSVGWEMKLLDEYG